MLEVIKPGKEIIGTLAHSLRRDQLQMHEHTFLGNEKLIENFLVRQMADLNSPGSICLSAMKGGKISGYVSFSRNDFDSEIFGFSCFQVNELIILEEEMNDISSVVKLLLESMGKLIAEGNNPCYYILGLNNNTRNVEKIFNALAASGCNYLHTLLTFASNGERFEIPSIKYGDDLRIRIAEEKDAEEVALLAQRSFSYSRFHLDPFLDQKASDRLHYVSARNSLLEGFADIMFVAEKDEKIIGYYSGKKKYYRELEKTIGKAVISAVDSAFRGQGVFAALDTYLLNWFADNTDFAEMGTYLINYPVHRVWIKKGLPLIRGTHQFSKMLK